VGAQRLGALGDPGARALACRQPALGHEFRVRVGDRVASDAQVGGERAIRGQTGARGEPSTADGLAQGPDQGGASAARTGQFQMQVGADALGRIDP
jgi:hypothetical protein